MTFFCNFFLAFFCNNNANKPSSFFDTISRKLIKEKKKKNLTKNQSHANKQN